MAQNESKKINIARERLYEGNRVVEREWGKERKDGEDVGSEDVTQILLHTDNFIDAFYTQTFLHTFAFTHKHVYIQTFLHTEAFTHRGIYTQTLLHTLLIE